MYTPVKDANGNIIDIKVSYDESYVEQHLRYSSDYSVLPNYN
jgi:dipeptidyl-peptidase III